MADWGDVPTWLGFVAAAVAVLVTLRTFKSSATRDAELTVSDMVGSLSVGEVGAARSRLAAFAYRTIHEARSKGGSIRQEKVECVRDDVFMLLWSLQRAAGVRQSLHRARAAQKDVLFLHVELISELVEDVMKMVPLGDLAMFSPSSDLTIRSLEDLYAVDVDRRESKGVEALRKAFKPVMDSSGASQASVEAACGSSEKNEPR